MSKKISYAASGSLFLLLFFSVVANAAVKKRSSKDELVFYAADHPKIQYTGRIDFTNSKLPRFWQPGVYINIKFFGSYCEIIINDEVLWGKNHNYLEIVVDGVEKRIQTKSAHDTIMVADGLADGVHTLQIVKNTEANIGYLEFVGVRCEKLLKPDAKPRRKIEFIGNSITCGAGNDISDVPCGKGVWHDQHNAYLSYGAITARALEAQYHLSAVSGIGLMHSCCNMNIIMPPVFDKISMRNDTIQWDFKKYQPDVITVCLGQNDGIQDSTSFSNNYINFFKKLRAHYPKTTFILLSSPMADDNLREFMSNNIAGVIDDLHRSGEKRVFSYIFTRQYPHGCDGHPDLNEHEVIAGELAAHIKKIMKW
ncbi:MAG: SGNH/GDSL hydrolase family protein [Chitinophagaceae bacterium]